MSEMVDIDDRHVHIRGFRGDEGENETVLSVSWPLGLGDGMCAVIIGTPQASPLLAGYMPEIAGFSCGIETVRSFVATLQRAIAAQAPTATQETSALVAAVREMFDARRATSEMLAKPHTWADLHAASARQLTADVALRRLVEEI